MTEERPEPIRLSWRIVEAIRFNQILQHGGIHGVKDKALIESALSRPINKWFYEGTGVFSLAAAYAFGIGRNHGFQDGNQRTSFLASTPFSA